jgi:hypothetical protein
MASGRYKMAEPFRLLPHHILYSLLPHHIISMHQAVVIPEFVEDKLRRLGIYSEAWIVHSTRFLRDLYQEKEAIVKIVDTAGQDSLCSTCENLDRLCRDKKPGFNDAFALARYHLKMGQYISVGDLADRMTVVDREMVARAQASSQNI